MKGKKIAVFLKKKKKKSLTLIYLFQLDGNYEGLTVYPIRFLSEFKNFYRIAMNNLKNQGTKKKDSEPKGSSHLIVSIIVKKVEISNQELTRFKKLHNLIIYSIIKREIVISKLTFVKLADSDNLEKCEDFREMASFLQEFPFKRKEYKDENILVSVLNDCVTSKSENIFFCLVSGTQSIYGPCLQAMKVCFNLKLMNSAFFFYVVHTKNPRANGFENTTAFKKNFTALFK